MFLRRPLTNERITKEKNDEFSFGYPHNLIAGVTLTDKKEQKTKKIFSLYELEIVSFSSKTKSCFDCLK